MKVIHTAFLFFVLAVLGCGSDNTFQLGSLEIITGSGVTPDAGEDHLRFDATGAITYEQYNQFSDRFASWQDQLTATEKAHLEDLCDAANVLGQQDISAPADPPCLVGGSAIQVLAGSSTGLMNSFTIAGEVLCDPDLIPAGVNALLAEADRLKTKYQP
ncbi:MAG: hypothetical protein AABZ10_05170 [Nitrospirota bacterium]